MYISRVSSVIQRRANNHVTVQLNNKIDEYSFRLLLEVSNIRLVIRKHTVTPNLNVMRQRLYASTASVTR